MISKKSVRKWEAIAVILATLLTIVGGSYPLAISQAASINNALGSSISDAPVSAA